MSAEAGLWCVVPAAGTGSRFGGQLPKQYTLLQDRPVLWHTLERLAGHPAIAGIMLVLAASDTRWHVDPPTLPAGLTVKTAIGGASRADSVLAGLAALPDSVADEHFVLVHDAARPCVRAADISRLIEQAGRCDGGLLAAPLRDTLKRADAMQYCQATEPRGSLWRAFTPQMFRRAALTAALQAASDRGIAVTDESMAMELTGLAPLLVEGAEDNIKITTPADLALADFLLRSDS